MIRAVFHILSAVPCRGLRHRRYSHQALRKLRPHLRSSLTNRGTLNWHYLIGPGEDRTRSVLLSATFCQSHVPAIVCEAPQLQAIFLDLRKFPPGFAVADCPTVLVARIVSAALWIFPSNHYYKILSPGHKM